MSTLSGRALPLNSELPADRCGVEVLCFTSVILLSFFPTAARQPNLNKTIQLMCLSPKQWTVKCTETWRSAMKGKWSNPLPSPRKMIFTNLQNRYRWQKMTKTESGRGELCHPKITLHFQRPSINTVRQASVDAETSAWPHSGPVCMQTSPSLTST